MQNTTSPSLLPFVGRPSDDWIEGLPIPMVGFYGSVYLVSIDCPPHHQLA